jgi:hypothetical protein
VHNRKGKQHQPFCFQALTSFFFSVYSYVVVVVFVFSLRRGGE